jgi:hypothetical protein
VARRNTPDLAVRGEIFENRLGGARVREIGSAHLKGRGACHQELDAVTGSGDAADANDGDRDGSCELVDDAQRDGLECGS